MPSDLVAILTSSLMLLLCVMMLIENKLTVLLAYKSVACVNYVQHITLDNKWACDIFMHLLY